MRILLVTEAPKEKILYVQKHPPMGVLYIASYLESKGISTDVLDCNIDSRKNIDFAKYDVIGFSMNAGNVENTLATIEAIKKTHKSKPIIVGGSHAKLISDQLIRKRDIDCLIVDEGEDIFYNYVKATDKTKVKGIMLRNMGKPFYTGKAEQIEDLDSLPFPAIDKVPYKRYRIVPSRKNPACPIITSRGCPYGCIFCYHSLSYNYRTRSPENVIKEIKWLKELGINEIWIADDNFTNDVERAERICDLIIKNRFNISITLANGVRADKLNDRLLSKLKQAGCWLLTVAPEVGTNNSLGKIKKGFSLEDVERVVRKCKTLGLATMSVYIIGFPWEGEKDILETMNFAKKLDTDLINVNRLIPYPYTPLWDMVKGKEYSLKDEKRDFQDDRFRHPILSEQKLQLLYKQFYREFYSPWKIIHLLSVLKPSDLAYLGYFAMKSKSV